MNVPGFGVRNLSRVATGDSTANSNLLLAQLLQSAAGDTSAFATEGAAPASLRLVAQLQNGGNDLRSAFAALAHADQVALRDRFGSRLEEFLAIAGERDHEMLQEDIAALARRAQLGEDGRTAAALWNYLAERGSGAVRDRAAHALAALQGRGSFGERFEATARGFAAQASDPRMILSMGVASWISSAVRLGTLSRLAASPAATFWTRGLGASTLASSAAWFAEVPAFWASDRALRAVTSSESMAWDARTVGREFASLGMMLGFLRLGGAAANGLSRRIYAVEGAGGGALLDPWVRFSQGGLASLGTLGGIYLDHRVESRLGWRPDHGSAAALSDSLATLLQFQVGGHLAAEAWGPRFAEWQRRVEFQSEWLSQRPESALPSTAFPGIGSAFGTPTPVAVGGAEIRPGLEGDAPWRGLISQMSSLKPPRRRAVSLVPASEGPGNESVRPSGPSPEEILKSLYAASAGGRDRLVKQANRQGRLAGLALAQESQGFRPELSAEELTRAQNRLEGLENRFWLFLYHGREQVPPAKRWERLQEWQNELFPADLEGLGRLQEMARRLGITDFFQLKAAGIQLKSKARSNQDLADYFFDLSLVRDFLKKENLHRVEEGSGNAMFLSHLLLNGDGNCVSLSLLFAHLAGLAGRPLQIGLLPNHLFLVGKHGSAIESTLDFGVTQSSAYRGKAILPDERALASHGVFGVHLLNLGKAALLRGDLDRAERVLTLARDLLPTNPRPYLHLGQLYQRRGAFEAAAQNYYRVYSLYPNDPRGYNNLRFQAWERVASGRHAEAEPIFRRMNDLQPEDLDALRGLEWVYHRIGKPKSAADIARILEILEEEP